ncbi:MAG: OmpA family protein [Nitrospirae bacterium]|nr:OmpA family protein [Nitrospirota bacterium]
MTGSLKYCLSLVTRHFSEGTEDVTYKYKRLVDGFDETTDSDGNWLISLSDLLSLLLVFFIMFVVMSKGPGADEKTGTAEEQSHARPAARPDRTEAAAGEEISDEIKSGMDALALSDDITVLATGREIIITIKERVTFRPAEADVLDSFKPVLDNIAEVIHKYPYFHAEITGHTDNVPINTFRYPSNWELSVARAAGVLKYFINDHGIDSSRLSIKGNADQRPVAPNDTPENRAQNRRVEIRLKRMEA